MPRDFKFGCLGSYWVLRTLQDDKRVGHDAFDTV